MLEPIDEAIRRGIERVRELQHPEGYWLGHWRVAGLQFHYGIALLDAGHPESSDVIQDLCDQFEGHARADGGFSFAEEAPSSVGMTTGWVAFLERCRPRSPVLAPARAFLAKKRKLPAIPGGLVIRWMIDESSHARVLRTRPPSRLVRRLGWRFASKLIVPPTRGPQIPNIWTERLGVRVAQALAWPLPDDLERDLPRLSLPFAVPMYLSLLALQLLATEGPLLEGREEMLRLIGPWLDELRYDDDSMYYFNAILPSLTCLRQLGRHGDVARVQRAVERVSYQRGGWLGTPMAGMNVFDTALTVQALLACDVPTNDAAITRGCAFLHEAQRTDGTWSWAWVRPQGGRQRLADTDDSGAALLALLGAKQTPARAEATIASLLRLQAPQGGFVVFDMLSAIYNPVTPSNTARVIRALCGLGLRPDHPAIIRASDWLVRNQREDGAWFDFWFNDPIYGTAMALEALAELGVRERGHPDVERGVSRILRDQNADGGWGYDFYGRRRRTSVVEQTSWAVHALCTLSRPQAIPMTAVAAGVRFLLARQRSDGDWPATGVAQWNGSESYTDSQFPLSFALRALGAYRRVAR